MLIGREPFACDRESASCTPEWIITPAAVSEGLVLDTASALIERGVRELHDVERVSNLGGIGEHRVEHGAIRRRQIQRGPLDLVPPRLVACGEPATWLHSGAAGHDVEELAAAHIDDLSRPLLGAEPANAGEQRLIQPERGDRGDPVGMIHELFTDDNDGVHHGVPPTTELTGDVGHGASVAADLQRRPPSCPCGQRAPGPSDLMIGVGPAATTPWASPSLLAPHQPAGRPNTGRSTNTTSRIP